MLTFQLASFLLIYWSKCELDLLWLRQKKYSFDERYIAHRAICKYENVGVYASFVIAWIFGTTVCFNWIWFVVSPPPSLSLSLSLKNHPIFNVTLFRRHYWTPVSATAAELNGIMQNSQFWGKNDASTHNGPEFRIFMFKTLLLKICSIFNGTYSPINTTQRQSLLVLGETTGAAELGVLGVL